MFKSNVVGEKYKEQIIFYLVMEAGINLEEFLERNKGKSSGMKFNELILVKVFSNRKNI